jgi:putative holliday junction resolvase
MKIIALDIGDAWTGIAISDPLGMFARPLKTVATKQLTPSLHEIIEQESIKRIVVGYPKTMRGTQSEQTQKVVAATELLKKEFTNVEWILWDERLSSKMAGKITTRKTKEEKLQIHAVAAAYILSSYLEFFNAQKSAEEQYF